MFSFAMPEAFEVRRLMLFNISDSLQHSNCVKMFWVNQYNSVISTVYNTYHTLFLFFSFTIFILIPCVGLSPRAVKTFSMFLSWKGSYVGRKSLESCICLQCYLSKQRALIDTNTLFII